MSGILIIKSSFKLLQAKYGSDSDFPLLMKVYDDLFYYLQEAENAILPLTLASFLMQLDRNNLADVVDVLGRIFHFPPCIRRFQLSLFIYLLGKRWKQQEQTVCLLACMMHPRIYSQFSIMVMFHPSVNVMEMTNYDILYYKNFIGDNYGLLPQELNNCFAAGIHRLHCTISQTISYYGMYWVCKFLF